MYAVPRWIALTVSTLLLVAVGCSSQSAPSDSSPPPQKTAPAPTMPSPPPEKTAPAMPAPQERPMAPAPAGAPSSEAEPSIDATSPEPQQTNPLRSPRAAKKSSRPEKIIAKHAAPEQDKARLEGEPSAEKFAEEPMENVAAEKAAPDGQTLFMRQAPEEKDKKDAADQPDYTVVKVYYATDRSPLCVAEWLSMQQGGWPTLTGLCAVATVVMFWRTRRQSIVLRILAWFMLMTTVVIGGLTVVYQLQPAPPDRPIERMYGNDRGELELGTCEVSVPKEHETGALESPSVLRLEFRQDTKRHVVLLGVHPESPSSFYADLHKCIEGSDRKEAFVFVHGYNVGFETAVRRTAQIAYDLKFQGAPIVYSWPSQEGLFSYTVDETNVVWTVPHLKEFLVAVAEQSGATAIHLIAHSMGNRALTSALRELVMDRNSKCPQFHEVILTAPDIDAEVFRRDIAPAIIQSADRVTLYASSNDEALVASRTVHGYRRAGESGDNVVIVPGVDTVDVSEIDTSLIGHSYYGSNSTVLADLFELMQGSKPPDQRQWLQSMRLGALKYWKFLREKFHPISPATSPPPPGEEL